jgi:hypothetical protein
MDTRTCCCRAAVVATITAALSVAGEPTGVVTSPDRAAATRPRVASQRQGLGGLELRQPYWRSHLGGVASESLVSRPSLPLRAEPNIYL